MMLDEQQTESNSEATPSPPDAETPSAAEAGAHEPEARGAAPGSGPRAEGESAGTQFPQGPLPEGAVQRSGPQAQAAPPETPAASQETAPDLAAELAREREKATDYMNRWQRAQADLSNYKRRAEQEREQLQKYGPFPLYLELLKMLDNFQRAFETLPPELREFSWVQGVALSYMQLDSMLRMNGVTPFETKAGEPFDPAVHEAVTHEETDAYPDGTITAEYQRGYKLFDRVLRPALVRVAKATSLATEQK